nr:hypothetical protein [Tanacetum cinerariifolium]
NKQKFVGQSSSRNDKVVSETSDHDMQPSSTGKTREYPRWLNGYYTKEEGTSRFSRLGKLEFPKLHGDDVKGWMFRVKQFFAIDNVQEEDKIKMVSIHLYDKALAWHLQFMKVHGDTVVWNVYEESILKRFGAINEDPMAVRVLLWLCLHAKHPAINENPPRKQLSQKELAEKRAKNLCFYFDRKYMPRHKCSGQMYALEVSPCEEENELEDLESEQMRNPVGNNIQWNFKELVMKFVYEGKSLFEGHTAISIAMVEWEAVTETVVAEPWSLCAFYQLYLALCNLTIDAFLQSTTTQKDAIEAVIKELLDTSVVRPSHSPFSSPIVLVKKKDGSWRMCIDYTQLTIIQSKTNFQFQELIDEVCGAKIFSKLDLRRFIRGYATISQPLTALLKKNAFEWCPEAQQAFETLQQATTEAPVIALPNFNEEFVIKRDASGPGYEIGAVLQQQGHPIAFLSKALAPKQSAYEKELLAVVLALQKWREIEYKKGKEDVVADALSRIERRSVYSLQLRRKGKWVVGVDDKLRAALVHHFHSSVVGGHSVVQATLKRLGAFFYWKGMRKMVKETVWKDISMDFILFTPLTRQDCIIVVVDTLSKYAHFIALTHPYTAKTIAQLFLDNIYRLHGLPTSITLQAREEATSMLKFNLKKSQDRMKSQKDKYRVVAEPIKLLERKIVKQQNHMGVFGLIQWSNGTEDDATWEDLADIVKRFPSFVLDP